DRAVMRIIRSSDTRALALFAGRDEARHAEVERQAARIVDDVRRRGDKALMEWTNTLDRKRERPVRSIEPVPKTVLKRGWKETPRTVRNAIALAARNLERVASQQVPRGFTVKIGRGHVIEQRVQPLARVGCYVPGGRYPL